MWGVRACPNVEGMRQIVRIWNNLIIIAGGSLALYKICWRLLAWEMERGELQLVIATK